MPVLEPGRDRSGVFGAGTDAAPSAADRVSAGSGVARRLAGRGSVVTQQVGTAPDQAPAWDLADLVGQPVARRAAEIYAAGSHHLMLLGLPGAGKPILELRVLTAIPARCRPRSRAPTGRSSPPGT